MVVKTLYCKAIVEIGGSGASGDASADLYTYMLFNSIHPQGKQEIGIWIPSRHKTFRTRT